MSTRPRQQAGVTGAAGTGRGHRGRTLRITALSGAVLLTGTGLLLVAGCSGSAGSSATASEAVNGAAVPSAATAGHRAAARFGAANPAGGTSAVQTGLRVGPTSQSIIYTASLTLRVRDAALASSSAATYVSDAGGYTADEQARASGPAGRRPTISLTLKVPVAQYPAALRKLASLGRQTSLSQQSTDVTEQVADVGSRVTSEQDAIAQLRTLLRRAGSVTGLLQVQEQISSDESSLEALLAQQRALSHETSYATISLRLLGPRPRVAHHHGARHGFGAGLAAGWHGLRNATVWVLTALGVVAPFAVVIAIIGGLGYLGRRRLSRRSRRRAPAAGAG